MMDRNRKIYECKVRCANETACGQLFGGQKLLKSSRIVFGIEPTQYVNTKNIIHEVGKLADIVDTSEDFKLLANIDEVNIDAATVQNQLTAITSCLQDVEKFNEPVKRQNESDDDWKFQWKIRKFGRLVCKGE